MVDLQLGRRIKKGLQAEGGLAKQDENKLRDELRVEAGLASLTTMSPIASRGWTCTWDNQETTSLFASQGLTCDQNETSYMPSFMSMMDL